MTPTHDNTSRQRYGLYYEHKRYLPAHKKFGHLGRPGSGFLHPSSSAETSAKFGHQRERGWKARQGKEMPDAHPSAFQVRPVHIEIPQRLAHALWPLPGHHQVACHTGPDRPEVLVAIPHIDSSSSERGKTEQDTSCTPCSLPPRGPVLIVTVSSSPNDAGLTTALNALALARVR